MEPLPVVEVNPLVKPPPKLRAIVKGMEIKIVILECPPQALDENVVLNPATAVHADFDAVGLQQPHKSPAGKLGPLVGVEDLRFSISKEGLLQGFYAEFALKGV
jgi:hypothetical protein